MLSLCFVWYKQIGQIMIKYSYQIMCKIVFCLSAGELLTLLNVSSDEKVLPTTYGELRPPLGKHRLKVSFYCSLNQL